MFLFNIDDAEEDVVAGSVQVLEPRPSPADVPDTTCFDDGDRPRRRAMLWRERSRRLAGNTSAVYTLTTPSPPLYTSAGNRAVTTPERRYPTRARVRPGLVATNSPPVC